MDQSDVEFETLQEEYSARSFYEHYKEKLPQMVMVTQGYLGEVGFETFDRGQVFRIQTYSSQKRVVAVIISGEKGMYGLQGRQISIPADYDVKFHVIKHGKPKSGKAESLREIITHKELPLEVQFAGSEDQAINIGGSERKDYQLFTLKLLNTYDDFYLLGNAICYGNLYGSVTAVPAYLPDLRFSIVKSIKGYTEEQYQNFLTVANQFVKDNITFDPTFGNTDIALYSHDKSHENESYSYISPCEYYNIEEILRNNKPKPRKQTVKQAGNVYEVIRVSTCSLGSESNPTYDTMNVDHAKAQFGDTVIKNVRNSPKPTKANSIQQKVKDNGHHEVGETTKQSSTVKIVDEESLLHKKHGPPVPHKPETIIVNRRPFSDSSDSKGSDLPPSVPKRNSIITSESETNTVSVTQIRKTFDPIYVGRAVPVQQQSTAVVSSTDDLSTSTVIYAKSTKQSFTSPQNLQQSTDSGGTVDIKSLTIEDVCDWLKKLNLNRYCGPFLENQVDGCLLMELDKNMLKEDFGMRDFDILKLMKFAQTGYVPKSRGSDQ